ncbi:IS66 family element%2C orf1 [Streptococcus pneumoniae]|uniref:hypothetical protein n=1 Tax=Streptococcus pneumoniae TaxID=1313 RepID=UPI0005E1BAB9|nr:hypothetical protein [Streptococcus pneumoniae]CIX39694.1 IS66 family element%2C orf1 [Streptococcus pneumoniae]
MPQPIVPVEIPQSRLFDSKKRNDILLKIRIGKLEVSFFQSLNLTTSKQCFELTSSVPSTTSKQCFEQPAASFLFDFH